MRFEGTLRSWNETKGFGFIAPRDGGREIFVHITAFKGDGSKPTIGESVSYELGSGKDGKPKAINITRKAIGQKPPKRSPLVKPKSSNSLVGTIFAIFVISAIAVLGFKYVEGRVNRHELAQQAPQPLLTSSPIEHTTSGRTCDGRLHCSQMTSCAEAKWFINNCPGTKMDGNNDGTPCEQQWCTSPFAK